MPNNIVIVGAGPAGLVLAYGLAREGRDVIIFDHRAPWEKPCGGMLGPGTLEEHAVLSDYPYSINLCKSVLLELTHSKQRSVTLDPPLPVVSRIDFNKYLLDKAIEAGAEFIKQKVVKLSWNFPKWTIKTDQGSYNADLIVGADGVNSIVRESIVGRIHRDHLSLTCGYFVSGITKEQNIIKFLDVLGYIWVFSRSDHASAGICARLGTLSGKKLFEKLNNFLDGHYFNIKILRRWSALVPTIGDDSFYEQPCCGNNWMLIGDAAGHVDPVTGEGITYALQSAVLACKSIINDDMELYESAWRAKYGYIMIEKSKYMKKLINLTNKFEPALMGAFLYNYFCEIGNT